MKKFDIIEKIPKLPITDFRHTDAQVVLRLITILAACHLSGKVNRILKRIQKLENPDEVLKYLK